MIAQVAVISGLLALTVSLITPVFLRPVLQKLGVVDVPNERSSHTQAVLRGLGLGVLLALVIAGGIATILLFTEQATYDASYLLAVGVFSFFAGLLGFSEDLKGVSVKTRSILLLSLATSASIVIVALGGNWQNPALKQKNLDSPESFPDTILFYHLPTWLLIVIGIYGVLFISGYINVANFMDGLNGISGLHGVIAGLTFAVTGAIMELPWLLFAGIALGSAFLGFLPWNLSKKGGFLGDVGSYLLGGSVAITSFAALSAGVPLLATIGPMVIYFGDVAFTLVKRVRAGHRWDEPHKEHVYQILQQQGRSHLHSSLIVGAFSLITAALGVVSIYFEGPAVALFLFLGITTLVVYLFWPRLKAVSA